MGAGRPTGATSEIGALSHGRDHEAQMGESEPRPK
jgi:hypothetical protein